MKHPGSHIAALILVGLLAAPCFAPIAADVDISVTKQAEDAEGILFNFSGEDFDSFFDFDLYAGEIHQWAFPTAHKNQFEVREIVPDGWKLTDIIVDVMDPDEGWDYIDLTNGSVLLTINSGVDFDIAFDVTFVNERINSIPAPGDFVIGGIGLIGIGWLRRRKTI